MLQRCAELGVSYVKVSEHLGARVTNKNDYTNHSWWQGKVYKIDWNKPQFAQYKHEAEGHTKEIADMIGELQHEYPDFVDTCGYGDVQGICGANCRHSFSAFYPNIQTAPEPWVDKKANEKRYKEEQKARALERQIRATKREIAAYDGSKLDNPEVVERLRNAHARLDKQVNNYYDYCRTHKINADGSRMIISKGKEIQPEKITSTDKAVKEYARLNNKSIAIIKDNIGEIKPSVILTDERLDHIKNGVHPQDYEYFAKYGEDVITNPEILLQSKKDANTILMLKHIEDTNVNVVVKLALINEVSNNTLENSIITSYRIGDRSLKKLLRKNKILYKIDEP